LKFVFIGGVNTVFSLLSYTLFALFLQPAQALLIAYIMGVLFSYITTTTLVFDHRLRLMSLFCYILVYVLIFGINLYLLGLLINSSVNKYIAQVYLQPFIALFSFLLLKLFVFSRTHEKNN
jgi:putative flippase GtrA